MVNRSFKKIKFANVWIWTEVSGVGSNRSTNLVTATDPLNPYVRSIRMADIDNDRIVIFI